MSLIGSLIIPCLVLAADGQPAPKLPLGKDTTYVTGPLDKEGYIDYEAALNDRLGKGVLPEKNANVLLWKALGPTPEGGKRMPADFFKRMGMDEPPKDGAYFIALRQFMKDQLKLGPDKFDAIYDQQSRAAQRPWAAKDYPNIAAWLEANEKPLVVVAEATRRPDYFNPLVTHWIDEKPGGLTGILLPGIQTCRECAVALAARAMLRVGEGKFDEAWQDLLACHRLGLLVGRGGSTIEGLVGVAIDAIASRADLAYIERADLTVKQTQDRQNDLLGLPATPPMADKIDLAERLTHLELVQMIRQRGFGRLEALSHDGPDHDRPYTPKPGPDGEKALTAMDWAPALRDCNHLYDRLVAAMRVKDRADRDKQLKRVQQDIFALRDGPSESAKIAEILLGPPDKSVSKAVSRAINGVGFRMLGPYGKVLNAHDRDVQVQRNLQVAFALAAYHRDHGDYPAKLDNIAPKYLATIPDDLFSGKALIYHPTDKGYLFYSVGPNGKDDGGRSLTNDLNDDDLPVTMPLPELKKKL
jgi:hypothetical protein